MWTFIFIALIAWFFISAYMKSKEIVAEREAEAKKPRVMIDYIYLVEIEHAEEFQRFYRDEFDENDDYSLPKKDLIEDFEGERVYKFEPLPLPTKIEGNMAYSYMEDGEWVKVGRVKKTDMKKLALGKPTLLLYSNTFKRVYEDEIDEEERDPFFGIEIEEVMHDLN